jgi:hypothetical protein
MQTQAIINPVNMDNLPTPPPRTITYPSNPDWSFAGEDKGMLSSAYNVIQQNEGWSLLINFQGDTFMFSMNTRVKNLMDKINDAYDGGHSGSSMGNTMRNMEYIANYGFDEYFRLKRSQS